MSIHFKVTFLFLTMVSMMACATNEENRSQIERRFYNPWEKDIGYAQVVKMGRTIYLSGITNGAPTMEAQLINIYTDITNILADYGIDTTAVVKEVIYTKDIEALKKAIPHRKRFFKEAYFPAATWVQVERLFIEDHLLEVDIVAIIP